MPKAEESKEIRLQITKLYEESSLSPEEITRDLTLMAASYVTEQGANEVDVKVNSDHGEIKVHMSIDLSACE